jgi:hypothetical protein
MQNIGFVEKSDNEKTEMIKFLVDSAKGINTIEINKEVGPMTETTNDITEKSDDVVEESKVAPEADATNEDAVEKSYDMDKEEKSMEEEKKSDDMDEDDEETLKSDDMKEEAAEDEVSKSDDALGTAVADIKDTVTKAFSDLTAVVQAQAEQIAELHKSLATVKNEVTASKDVFNEFGKRVDAVEADTAFRKSGDLGEIIQETQPEQVEKSLWGGRFLKTADLFK